MPGPPAALSLCEPSIPFSNPACAHCCLQACTQCQGTEVPSCNTLALTCRACAGLNRETGVFDPAFREQFKISRPSQAYQALLATVPVAFVGSEERLTATVRLLCKELQTEFAEKGVTLPPWRDVQAMLTKWRPSAGPSARASMGSAPAPRPAVHQAAAAQLLQPPAAVKHDFFLGVPSLSNLTPVHEEQPSPLPF